MSIVTNKHTTDVKRFPLPSTLFHYTPLYTKKNGK